MGTYRQPFFNGLVRYSVALVSPPELHAQGPCELAAVHFAGLLDLSNG